MELSSLILPLTLFTLSSLCFILFFKNQRPSPKNYIKGYPIVGNLPSFIKNIPRMMEWSTELISASPSGTVVLPPFIFTSNPDIVEHMAKSHFDNYIKAGELTAALHDFLGRGILNVNGEEWKLQRKSASYEFSSKSIRSFTLDKVRHEVHARLMPFLRDASRAGRVVDLQEVLERFAFDNICSLVLGDDPDCLRERSGQGERFFHAFEEALQIIIERRVRTAASIWRLKKLLNIGSERRLKESMAVVHEFVDKAARSSSSKGTNEIANFLSRLAADESFPVESLRDVFISFVLAGRDTTPTALTWFFWNLSSRPDVVGKILDELKSVRSRHDQDDVEMLTVDMVRDMNYLHAAISESLRLYPPVPLLPRKCVEDDVLPDGTEVKRGWMVMYNAYKMARTEKIWGEDSGEYRPERWLEETGAFRPRNQFEYPVFHAGPRMCLGKEMAYIQMKVVAASILEGLEVEVVEERGRHDLGITMRMGGGLPVKIKERN